VTEVPSSPVERREPSDPATVDDPAALDTAPRPPVVTPPPPPFAAGPAPAAAAADGDQRGLRRTMSAALVGALVGALVSSGVYLAVDDNNSSTVSQPVASNAIVRPSDRVERTGDIASILKTDVPAVVAIVDDGGPDAGGAAGTGFVISANGVIVTNNHVVAGARKIQAVFSNRTDPVDAVVLGRNANSDLAVLKVDLTGLQTIKLGNSDAIQVGDDVVAIGNALALQGGLTVTRGIISGLHREVATDANSKLEDVIQTDAAINPGNSGGPLVDAQGQVIGINTAIADPSSAQNVGFAIPISQAEPIIAQLRVGKQPAYLGVSSEDVSQARAEGRKVSVDSGAVVLRVASGTPAAKAGLHIGDVIVEFDGKSVSSAAALGAVVRAHKPGDTVDLVIDRDGNRSTLSVTLAESPTPSS
jgi:S1-C subfamily serine protease